MAQSHSFNNGSTYPSSGEKQQHMRRAIWGDIAERFCVPQDCLASYLALESAEVLAGVKPANLLSIPNRTYPCGSNPYLLWKNWGRQVLDASPLQSRELTDRGDSTLVLLFLPEALEQILMTPAARSILRRAGYPEEICLEMVLNKLTERLTSSSFPHEIGVFLGYPLKDVAGFMGLARIPFTCQGPWKIYGDPRASLQLAETFRSCRTQMATELANCASPLECLGYCAAGIPFFCSSTDYDYRLHNAR